MKSRNEIRLLFMLHDTLELEWKSSDQCLSQTVLSDNTTKQSSPTLWWFQPYPSRLHPKSEAQQTSDKSCRCSWCGAKRTLMIITNVDWNNEGFALGSNTVELDWNDWKSPVMSRLSAKLFRKSTWSHCSAFLPAPRSYQSILHTKLEMAVLNKTSNVSSWADRSILCTPTEEKCHDKMGWSDI